VWFADEVQRRAGALGEWLQSGARWRLKAVAQMDEQGAVCTFLKSTIRNAASGEYW
jgi:hypothetical protein